MRMRNSEYYRCLLHRFNPGEHYLFRRGHKLILVFVFRELARKFSCWGFDVYSEQAGRVILHVSLWRSRRICGYTVARIATLRLTLYPSLCTASIRDQNKRTYPWVRVAVRVKEKTYYIIRNSIGVINQLHMHTPARDCGRAGIEEMRSDQRRLHLCKFLYTYCIPFW